MRKVLFWAVLALLIVFGITVERNFDGGSGLTGPGRTVDIMAFSTGEGLEPPVFRNTRRVPDEAVFVGNLTLRKEQNRPGFRVATFGPDFELRSHEVFDSTEEGETARFVRHCESQSDNTLMIFTVKGSVHNPIDEIWRLEDDRLRRHSAASYYFDPGRDIYRSRLDDKAWYGKEKSAGGGTRAWTRGTTSELWIDVPEPGPGTLYVRCLGLRAEGGRPTIEARLGEQSLGSLELPGSMTTLSWDIPEGMLSEPGLHRIVLESGRSGRTKPKNSKDRRDLGVMVDFVAVVPKSFNVGSLDKDPFETEVRTILDRFRYAEMTPGPLAAQALDLKWRSEGCAPGSEIVVSAGVKDSPESLFERRIPAGLGGRSEIVSFPPDLSPEATLRVHLEGPDSSVPVGWSSLESLCLRSGESKPLDRLFERLGARARPYDERSSSWAMIALRRPRGWINLAEAYSVDQGVSLAFTMGRDWTAYDRHRTEYVEFSTEGEKPKTRFTLKKDGLRSPFNKRMTKVEGPKDSFTFLAGGHLYGDPRSKDSLSVPDNLIANIETFNRQGADFFMALGDVVRAATPRRFDDFKSVFAAQLRMPLFNAVGNHDVGGGQGRKRYTQYFGRTSYHFVHKEAVFVVLDTELTGGEIRGEQLEWFREVLRAARSDSGIRTVFVCSHKLLWCVNRPEFSVVFDHLNSSKGYPTSKNFTAEILPELRRVAGVKPVYWLSGDIGVSWSLPAFFGKEDKAAITYVAVGMGETESDAVLLTKVAPDGEVSFDLIGLSGSKTEPIETYTVDYWKNHF